MIGCPQAWCFPGGGHKYVLQCTSRVECTVASCPCCSSRWKACRTACACAGRTVAVLPAAVSEGSVLLPSTRIAGPSSFFARSTSHPSLKEVGRPGHPSQKKNRASPWRALAPCRASAARSSSYHSAITPPSILFLFLSSPPSADVHPLPHHRRVRHESSPRRTTNSLLCRSRPYSGVSPTTFVVFFVCEEDASRCLHRAVSGSGCPSETRPRRPRPKNPNHQRSKSKE